MAPLTCPHCSLAAPPGGRFCAACGAALTVSAEELTRPYQPVVATSELADTLSPRPGTSPALAEPPWFTPGKLLAERYRIVAALGKGGMGEVYRADDLTLGQPVALKFLPRQLTEDPERLARFRQEVRVARQVAHPNVCRVYDIGEAEGQPFLTMEFIDGEDLAALLKKVGRLPEDRGLDVARQLCLGLAAAHDLGIVHRDLKPANIMIDGRGQVRITDFGLAGQAEDIHGTEVRHGTPAYQAPEQLAGREVSFQSDLYALGLILYELFTGKRAFPAQSREQLLRLQEGSTPSRPSSHVTGLDPAIERIILRCLEKDPNQRPRSAHQVLAELPGGDPLRAALAAGRTPSPEAVANADVEGVLPAWVGAALLGGAYLGLLAIALLADQARLFRQVPLQKSPQELTFQARALVDRLGVQEPVADRHTQLLTDENFLRYWLSQDGAAFGQDQLAQGRPAAMYFRYRQSPSSLVAERLSLEAGFPGLGAAANPSRDEGTVTIDLDLKGRLLLFQHVPAQTEPGLEASKTVAWDGLFAAAELDMAQFHRTTPQRLPPAYADERVAWEGTFPEVPNIPLRVEAAAYRGQPVYFLVGGPWDRSGASRPSASMLVEVFTFGFDALVFLVGGVLAYRNWRQGRADLRGALRLTTFALATALLATTVGMTPLWHYQYERGLLQCCLGGALYVSLATGLTYFALEPYLRRRWPWRLVSWQRVLAGRWRDALVGRDLLIGCAAGTATLLLLHLLEVGPQWWGAPSKPGGLLYNGPDLANVLRPVLWALGAALHQGLVWFFVLFFLCLLVRRERLAAGLVLVLAVVFHFLGRPVAYPLWAAFVGTLATSLFLFVALRYGLFALMVAMFVHWTLQYAPVTADLSTWYVAQTVVPVVAIAALAGYGFVLSSGGRTFLAGHWLGEE